MHKPPPTPPKPLATALAGHDRALANLVKSAMAYGANEPGAMQRGEQARARHKAALAELLRSQNAQAREWAINGLSASLHTALHSANARGPGLEVDWPKEIREALAQLKAAVW